MIETVLTGLLVALALYGFARIIITDCKGDWGDQAGGEADGESI
jgi:hypothetical protein